MRGSLTPGGNSGWARNANQELTSPSVTGVRRSPERIAGGLGLAISVSLRANTSACCLVTVAAPRVATISGNAAMTASRENVCRVIGLPSAGVFECSTARVAGPDRDARLYLRGRVEVHALPIVGRRLDAGRRS